MYYLQGFAFGALLLSAATFAEAQSLPFDFSVNGRLAVGATDSVPGADLFLFGDTSAQVSFGRFGLEIGVFGLADALDTPHETYAALYWDFAQGGRLSAGVPRPAYDSFASSTLEMHFPSLSVARTGITRSQATFGAMFANFLPYGVRFENETDALRYAASVHAVPNQNSTIAGFGVAVPFGEINIEGAVEVSWGTSTEVAGKLQAHGRAGPVSGGLGLFLPGTVGRPDTVEVFASFEPFDRATISGVIQTPLDGSADPTAGVAARYAIRPDASVSLGVLTEAGANAAFNVFLDWRF
jgi:hypothetical protein